MNEHDLFAAMGGVKEKFLLEIEEPTHKRLPKHFALIAAMLALVLTACAAPVIVRSFDKLHGGEIVKSEKDKVFVHEYIKDNGERTVLDSNTIYYSGTVALDVEVDPEAPDSIEEHYIPLRLMDFCTVESCTEDGSKFCLSLSMKGVNNTILHDILYQQHALPEDGQLEVSGVLGVGAFERFEKTYGDISVLGFQGMGTFVTPLRITDDGAKYYPYSDDAEQSMLHMHAKFFFWSDGMYLYCLKLPIAPPIVNDSDIEEILTSLTMVEDISEYLPAAE